MMKVKVDVKISVAEFCRIFHSRLLFKCFQLFIKRLSKLIALACVRMVKMIEDITCMMEAPKCGILTKFELKLGRKSQWPELPT